MKAKNLFTTKVMKYTQFGILTLSYQTLRVLRGEDLFVVRSREQT